MQKIMCYLKKLKGVFSYSLAEACTNHLMSHDRIRKSKISTKNKLFY